MKKYLLTGLVILLPIALTLMIIVFLFDFFTEPFVHIVGPIVDMIPYDLPPNFTLFLSRLLSLILLCLFILFLGFITQLFLIRNIIAWGNQILFKIPFINTVYKVSRDIFSAIFSSEGKKAFKRPVMIPFPQKTSSCLGFEAGEVAAECQQKVEVPLMSVFTPTAPHPISGFLFLIPKEDVRSIDMSNEEMIKFLVSCGMILPDSEVKDTDEHPF